MAALIAVALFGSGCEWFKEDRGRGDAPITSVNDEAADVYQFPDRYPGVATKCVGAGYRAFVTDRTDSFHQLVVVEDSSC